MGKKLFIVERIVVKYINNKFNFAQTSALEICAAASESLLTQFLPHK